MTITTEESIKKHLLILTDFINQTVISNRAMSDLLEAKLADEPEDYLWLLKTTWEDEALNLLIATQKLEESVATLYLTHTTFTLAK